MAERSTSHHKVQLAAATALLAISGLVTAPDPTGAADLSTPAQLSAVATHGWAAAQPTTTGRQLVEIEVHDGKVWAGYGDYAANTGPVTVASYDPTGAGSFVASTEVDTEAIYNLRVIGEQLVAPATDPRAAADFALGEPWHQARPLRATHVYDTATFTGTDLWMVGSQGRDAVAWRSVDGGQTWTEALRQSPSSGDASDFLRFYFAAPLNGRLYVQAVSYVAGAADASSVFDGTKWSAGPSLLTNGGVGWKPQPFGGGLIYRNSGQGRAGNVHFFDGASVRTIGVGWDVEIDGDVAYLLDLDGTVQASRDLATWVPVAVSDSAARSLAVEGTELFVGTANSTLLGATIRIPSLEPAVVTETTLPSMKRPAHGANEQKCPKGWQRSGRC